ncbi:DUF3461 family protein [Salinibius halmophilus]|uniref:DUF3461 family protein n=1 Tax=Salinibius halmophilus TaxID=1853216 RepID=UPI000E6606C9|nr:DUF3461 family protein [Salinibius halmophilus]
MSNILKDAGITDVENIEKYTLRQEGDNDVLKIYYKKAPNEFFARSAKYKYPREKKRITIDSGTNRKEDIWEINPVVSSVVDELDRITHREVIVVDTKKKILKDLRHLEKVVANKIAEIERDLETLTENQR